MVLSRRWVSLFVAAAMLPFFTTAQEEDALRAAIRADIMSDPRSSEMSPTEIDALVEALAARAEEQGSAQDYLDAQNSFQPMEAPVYEVPPVTGWNPLTLAIGTLLVVLVGVALLILSRRKRMRATPTDGMVA